ncbi:hypothetical protein XI00_12585 [Bradyrhizobium sp. CCBAU 21359]|nr:hypothetical protein [Bradyrhizobium sp. CCBAU 21359]
MRAPRYRAPQIAFEQVNGRFIFGNLRGIEASDVSRSVGRFGLDQARADRRRLADARLRADRLLDLLQRLVALGRFLGTQGGEVLDLGVALQIGALQEALLEAAEIIKAADDVGCARRAAARLSFTGAVGKRCGADECQDDRDKNSHRYQTANGVRSSLNITIRQAGCDPRVPSPRLQYETV